MMRFFESIKIFEWIKVFAAAGGAGGVIGALAHDELMTWTGAMIAVGSAVLSAAVAAYHRFREACRDEDAADRKILLDDMQALTRVQVELEIRINQAETRLNEIMTLIERVGFDLRVMYSESDVSNIPTSGTNLVIVADVKNVLYFRLFDTDGEVVVDTNETRLTTQTGLITDLRRQLDSLRPPHKLTRSEKDRVVTAVTSIVGHTRHEVRRKLPNADGTARCSGAESPVGSPQST